MRATVAFLRRRTPGVVLTLGAVLGVACILLAAAAPLFHVRPLIFLSGSMSPTIPAGSLALARETPASSLRVGDVVTVPIHGAYVTHRIVEVTHGDAVASLVLQGDGNRVADDTVYQVTSAPRTFLFVPGAGAVVAWLSRPPGVFLLAGYAMFLFSSLRNSRRRRNRAGEELQEAPAVPVTAVTPVAPATPAAAAPEREPDPLLA